MNLKETMAELKKMGTAQNVKIYKRHGACNNLFGVSFSNLGQLRKKIKINHDLALKLWETNNTDAQTLGIMIADPNSLTISQADKWVKDINYYLLADLFAGLLSKSKVGISRMNKWIKSRNEFIKQCGFATLASLLKEKAEITDKECLSILRVIERDIHSSPNRARHAMNGAMIAIGVFRPNLSKEVFEAAKRIGKVEVDHGDTSCKTPDAVAYIKKALARTKKNKLL